jgi:alpha-tubulin suppressor-like RCC1 family protein
MFLVSLVACGGNAATSIDAARVDASPDRAPDAAPADGAQIDAAPTADAAPADAPAPADARQLTVGAHFSCLRATNGQLRCWGSNTYGQLGDGTTTTRLQPTAVLGGPFVQVSAGSYFACGVTGAGAALCWGRNDHGQLGDGTMTDRSAPVQVVGLDHGVRAISAGGWNTCALLDDATLRCWGDNGYGQVGDGTQVARLTPVAVSGLTGQVAVALMGAHACALGATGDVTCWGWAYFGELGDGRNGPNEFSLVPTAVVAPLGASTQLALGRSYTCATTTTGRIQCFGDNTYGQLGDQSHVSASTPVLVRDVLTPRELTAAAATTCAVRGDATATCWGANVDGELGNGTFGAGAYSLTPVPVQGIVGGVRELAGGGSHVCALTDAGRVFCWGYGFMGELGDGFQQRRTTAVEVVGL